MNTTHSGEEARTWIGVLKQLVSCLHVPLTWPGEDTWKQLSCLTVRARGGRAKTFS